MTERAARASGRTTAKAATRKTAIRKTATRKTAISAAERSAGTATAGTAATTPPSTTRRSASPTRGSLAAGAARAGGERAKRRGTPLISGEPPVPTTPDAAAVDATEPSPRAAVSGRRPAVRGRRAGAPGRGDDPPTRRGGRRAEAAERRAEPTPDLGASHTGSGKEDPPSPPVSRHRPKPVVTSGPSRKAAAKSGTRRRPSRQRVAANRPPSAAAVRPLKAVTEADAAAAAARAVSSSSATVGPGVEDLVRAAVSTLRVAAAAAGVDPADVEETVARTLAFVRRRLAADYAVDTFGFDEDFTENVALPVLRPLYKAWFRVEVRGVENIPATGGALVVANHSGTVAVDSLMTQVAVHDEHPQHRFLRGLGADLVFRTPFLGPFARRTGSTLASNDDAERLLRSGEVVGVWPEGFKGVGKPFSERYKLQRFGRGGFVAAALRSEVPIVPCAIVGAEEIYPMIGNLKTVARLLGMPYFPVTPTFPALGPLGLVPLPSKWIIEFGSPIDTSSLGPAAAEDPLLVFDLTDQVRETIQQSLYALLMQRRSVFF